MSPPEPLRRCLGCGERLPQNWLIRLGAVERELRLDLWRRAPGRGAYIMPARHCLERARRGKGLSRVKGLAGARFEPEALHAALGRELEQELARLVAAARRQRRFTEAPPAAGDPGRLLEAAEQLLELGQGSPRPVLADKLQRVIHWLRLCRGNLAPPCAAGEGARAVLRTRAGTD